MMRVLTFIAVVVLSILLARPGALAASPQSNDISAFPGSLGSRGFIWTGIIPTAFEENKSNCDEKLDL
jgi:hypothetical protein